MQSCDWNLHYWNTIRRWRNAIKFSITNHCEGAATPMLEETPAGEACESLHKRTRDALSSQPEWPVTWITRVTVMKHHSHSSVRPLYCDPLFHQNYLLSFVQWYRIMFHITVAHAGYVIFNWININFMWKSWVHTTWERRSLAQPQPHVSLFSFEGAEWGGKVLCPVPSGCPGKSIC